jgi:hypothetical protein
MFELRFLQRETMKNTIFWDITPCNPLEVNPAVHGMTSHEVMLFSACSYQPKTPDVPNEINLGIFHGSVQNL